MNRVGCCVAKAIEHLEVKKARRVVPGWRIAPVDDESLTLYTKY